MSFNELGEARLIGVFISYGIKVFKYVLSKDQNLFLLIRCASPGPSLHGQWAFIYWDQLATDKFLYQSLICLAIAMRVMIGTSKAAWFYSQWGNHDLSFVNIT